MLGRCKASLQRDAKMQALGLTLRDELGTGERVYYDGKGGLSRGQELGSLIDHAYPIKCEELTAFGLQGSDLVNYTLTVAHPKRGRLLYIGDREANWLCKLNANASDEECNVECVTLQAPPKNGSLEWANGWRGGEPPFTARYIGDGGEGYLNLGYGDAFDLPL